MNPQFDLPQRQSPVGVLVMFFDTLRLFGRALWPLLVITFLKFRKIDTLLIVGSILIVIAVISIVAYLRYRYFTFWLDRQNNEFIIAEGIFNKTRTVISLDKIQQVNISQSLIQRIIKVYAVEVDTAGSSESEAKIKAVTHEMALQLKSRLLDAGPIAVAADANASEKPFMHVSLGTLLKMGVTSNYIKTFGLILAFLITIWENIRHISGYAETPEIQTDFSAYFSLRPILVLSFLLLATILLVNIIRTVVKYFNFNIVMQNGALLLSFGLINVKSTILRPARVQIAAVSRNYFQKKMGISEMRIRQAGVPENNERKSAVEIPGCDDAERDGILELIFGELPVRGLMLKPNFRRLVFAIFLAIVLPLTVFALIAAKVGDKAHAFYVFIPVYILFVGLILWFSFKNYRLFVTPDQIIKQSGAWDVTSEIVNCGKIQAVTTSQLFWHKPLNIGSVTIHTAGGNLSFHLGNFETIKQHVNMWLYKIESSNTNWM